MRPLRGDPTRTSLLGILSGEGLVAGRPEEVPSQVALAGNIPVAGEDNLPQKQTGTLRREYFLLISDHLSCGSAYAMSAKTGVR